MKRTHPWHSSAFGRAARFLGSIQLAIPVLALVAAALAWGTYLESTRDAKIARSFVYGSWWFMGLMGLVCVSLVFAAVARFPWKRRHVGFLIVHASLVSLIVGGFTSLYGRVEGHIGLEQGTSSGTIELNDESVELVEHENGQFRVLGEASAPAGPGSMVVGGYPIQVAEIWANAQERLDVADDGAEPYRAVQIAFGPMIESAIWVGDEAKGEAPVIDGVRVRVLAAGSAWTPPAPTPSSAAGGGGYVFIAGEHRHPLVGPGQEAVPGWKVAEVKRFARASVEAAGLVEDPSKTENPAVEVTITNGKGSSERHTAFEKFPDMILVKPLAGPERSGARLAPAPVGTGGPNTETLIVYGDPPALKVAYLAKNGSVKQAEHAGPLPWTADLGARRLTFVKQFTRATEHASFVKGPPAKDPRPAIVVKTPDGLTPVPWKGMAPINLPGRIAVLRYGPRTVTLPFAIRLDQFRKTDYPGTDMAMAYESDVTVSLPDAGEQRQTISMNEPLVRSGWKVYQSGFVGDNVSVFSVMHDPGLTLTYLACTALCIGIVVTFYGRTLSSGHPGIPAPFSRKEQLNGSSHALDGSVAPDAAGSARTADAVSPSPAAERGRVLAGSAG